MIRVSNKSSEKKEDKEKKITFYSKEPIICPICNSKFNREELFSGRVNAGALTDELHRQYLPMQAFGEVYPLVYSMTVCPSCYYAAFKGDFTAIPAKIVATLSEDVKHRIEKVQRIFSSLDFQSSRRLLEGAASYYLGLLCYEHFPPQSAPTIKMGICALRASWLCNYLHAKYPNENYDYISNVFVKKAHILYKGAIEYEQSGKEQLSAVKNLGPDTDKNYGYEGVLYLVGMLELKHGQRSDPNKRAEALESMRRNIAKMFGLGRRSKAKPGPLLDMARDLYDKLKAELHIADESSDE